MKGARVSHYCILEKIGEGGMGEVFVALDETLQREVALKSIRADRRLNPESRARFLREARVLSQLEHPNICGIYDYVEGELGVDYLVLERVEGESLDRVEGLDRRAALRAALQIADVLVAAHAAGVVHRDLKPDNVMLGPSGNVKVLDFGLAASPDEGQAPPAQGAATSDFGSGTGPLTEAGSVMGTLHYMAPEQARGEPATSASDMFAFGLVLQELLTGTPGHAFDTPRAELLEEVQQGRSRPSGIPGAVGELVERLKDTSASRRPTAVEAVERIRSILDAPRRRRRRLLGAALVLAGLAGAAKYTLDLREANARTAEKKVWLEQVVSFLIEDFYEKLEPLGKTHLLREAAEKVVEYYASVPDGERSEVERLRHSLALLQAGRVFEDQGEHARSEQALDEALRLAASVEGSGEPGLALQAHLRQADATSELGDVATAMGRLSDAKELFLRSQASAAAAAELSPPDVRARAALSRASYKIGEVLMTEGDLTAASEAFLEALTVAQEGGDDPTDTDWLLTLAWSEFYIGYVAYERGDLETARVRFQAYHDIALRLVELEPENTKWKAELASTHTNLGGVWRSQGRPDRAAAEFEKAVATWRELVAHDPSNLVWLRELGVALSWLASIHEYRGDLTGALREYTRELEIWEQLLERGGDVADWEYLRTLSLHHVGVLLEATGQPRAAREHLARCIAAVRTLCANDPSNADWRRELASHQTVMARALTRSGELGAAREHIDEALSALTELCDAEPHNVKWLDLLIGCYEVHGQLQLAEGDAIGVLDAAAQAGELLDRLGEASEDIELTRASLHALTASAHGLEGAVDDARLEWQRSLDILGPLPSGLDDVQLLELRMRQLLALGRLPEARELAERIAPTGYRERTFVARLREQGIELRPAAATSVAGSDHR